MDGGGGGGGGGLESPPEFVKLNMVIILAFTCY